jgi:hypothetical protein
MQTYRVHALVLGSPVTSQLAAGGVAEAVNAFVGSARVTRIKALDEPATNGLKQFEVAIVINGEEFSQIVSSNDIYGPLYQQATSNVVVTGVEEVAPPDRIISASEIAAGAITATKG